MGVDVKALCYSVAKYDMVTINEAPNGEVMAAATLKFISLGPVETVKVLTEQGGAEVFKWLQQLGAPSTLYSLWNLLNKLLNTYGFVNSVSQPIL